MLNGLVAHGALITCLHAPGTTPDAFVHLLTELHRAGAGTVVEVAGLIEELGRIHDLLAPHNQQHSGPRRESESEARARRCEASKRMRSLSCGLRRHPLAIDSRLDVDAVLPAEVAAEVGRAAEVLTRLSAFPVGVAVWRDYHQRFYERYGIGSLVPVLEMVSGAGIGWPDGYPGTLTPEPLPVLSEREHLLLGLAQQAALDGLEEIALDETLITALEGDEALRRPPHLEVGIRVHSASADNPVRAGHGLAEPADGMDGLYPSVEEHRCGMMIVCASSSGLSGRHERLRRLAVTADERS